MYYSTTIKCSMCLPIAQRKVFEWKRNAFIAAWSLSGWMEVFVYMPSFNCTTNAYCDTLGTYRKQKTKTQRLLISRAMGPFIWASSKACASLWGSFHKFHFSCMRKYVIGFETLYNIFYAWNFLQIYTRRFLSERRIRVLCNNLTTTIQFFI